MEGTKVADAGLKELACNNTSHKALATLYLFSTHVTDAGLRELARNDTGLKALTTLYISGEHVTQVGIKNLKNARPKLNIQHK
jgi:hypothetical protein